MIRQQHAPVGVGAEDRDVELPQGAPLAVGHHAVPVPPLGLLPHLADGQVDLQRLPQALRVARGDEKLGVDLGGLADEADRGALEQLRDLADRLGLPVLEPVVDRVESFDDGVLEGLGADQLAAQPDAVGGIGLHVDAQLVRHRQAGGSLPAPDLRHGDGHVVRLAAARAAHPHRHLGGGRKGPFQQAGPVDGVHHRARGPDLAPRKDAEGGSASQM